MIEETYGVLWTNLAKTVLFSLGTGRGTCVTSCWQSSLPWPDFTIFHLSRTTAGGGGVVKVALSEGKAPRPSAETLAHPKPQVQKFVPNPEFQTAGFKP